MSLSGRVSVWLRSGLIVLVVILIATVQLSMVTYATTGELEPRALQLIGVGTNGGAFPNVIANYSFTFTSTQSATIGSIGFQFCSVLPVTTCTEAGLTSLSTTAATMISASPQSFTSVTNSTQGDPYLTRTASTYGASVNETVVLGNINNTSVLGTFYVQIATYTSTNATGTPVDQGIVAASINNNIVLTGIMPESLIFCTGATVPVSGTTPNTAPNCAAATSGNINFSSLFSPTAAATATSQMAASTNAAGGYTITVSGATLTSASSNTITALGSPVAPTIGVSEFGMNLAANTTASSTPAIGATPNPAPNGTTLKGQAAAGYNTGDLWQFNTAGATVANSANGTAGPTNGQTFTVSYIVEVDGAQAAGTYQTALTYICTSAF